jgi:hypothetical protein
MSFVKPENAAQIYVTQMQNRLEELIAMLQEHTQQVDDARAKEMFDKSAHVLTGLVKVFSDYSQNNVSAGQDLET